MPYSSSTVIPLLRYPGGKWKVRNLIVKFLLNAGNGISEPFAGGASVGLEMLRQVRTTHLLLNDMDSRVSDLWRTVKTDPESLIASLPLRLTTDVYREAKGQDAHSDPLLAARSLLIVNRGSNGGHMGGPIGGWDQTGSYDVSCRWNYDALVFSIREASLLLQRAEVTNRDGLDLLRDNPTMQAYIDPPYVKAGSSLYRHGDFDHEALKALLRQRQGRYVLSIDQPDYLGTHREDVHVSGNNGRQREYLFIGGTP